ELHPPGIHLRWRWSKDRIDRERFASPHARFERGRVEAEVILTIELNRVDEDADDDVPALRARALDEPRMPLVQRAHRRHQTETARGAPGPRKQVPQLRDRFDETDSHRDYLGTRVLDS